MKEFRRFLDSFIVYTNNPTEIEFLKTLETEFQPFCSYEALGKCIGAEFIFKLSPEVPQTLVYARRYIEKRLKNGIKETFREEDTPGGSPSY